MDKKMSYLLHTIAITLAVIGLFYPQSNFSQNGSAEPIKIGFLGPLTGDLASWGTNERTGIELAREEINKDDGLNGRKIEVIYEDSQCDAKISVSAIKKLIEIDNVQAIIGDTCSSPTLASAPIAEANEVVLITPTAGSNKLSQAGDYIFRNFVANSKYAQAAAKIFTERLDKKTAAVLYINNEYGVNMKESFAEAFAGEIVFSESYTEETKDFRSILSKLKDSGPEIVFLGGYYPDGALIIKQANELALSVDLFGASDAYEDPNLIDIAGRAAEGFRFTTVPFSAGPKAEEFIANYKSKYDNQPPVFADYAYDTFNIIVEAIKKCGPSGPEIKDCLYETNHAGASNQVRFDANGDLLTPKIIIRTIQNGEFVNYEN